MKLYIATLLGIALCGSVVGASAHETTTHPGTMQDVSGPDGINRVQSVTVVPGTVARAKFYLYDIGSWPKVLSDVRTVHRNPNGTWTIDFISFGHPHDFEVTRTGSGVVLHLAMRDHGQGSIEYDLRAFDATHSKLTITFGIGTPPQATPQQMRALLRRKAERDSNDVSSALLSGGAP
jgi:hypothetical protein